MSLELSDLRSFLTLADELHFGRAAERLHVTQPALTKQIHRLEEKIGGVLFVRHRRIVDLTPAGRTLRERSATLIREADVAEEMARLAVRGEAGTLRIGFGIATLAAGLPEVLLRFRARYPSVHLVVKDMSTPNQLAALKEGEMDVGFVRLPVNIAGIDTAPALQERLIPALPAGLSLRRNDLSRLADQPFVIVSRSTSASFYDHVIRTCRSAGFEPRIVQEASELFTVLNLVRGGLGVSLVPSSARLMRIPGVRFGIARTRDAQWPIGLAWRSDETPSSAVRKFLQIARDFFHERQKA